MSSVHQWETVDLELTFKSTFTVSRRLLQGVLARELAEVLADVFRFLKILGFTLGFLRLHGKIFKFHFRTFCKQNAK